MLVFKFLPKTVHAFQKVLSYMYMFLVNDHLVYQFFVNNSGVEFEII